jgi:hypothetical protein
MGDLMMSAYTMKWISGRRRHVLLTKRFAIKFPVVTLGLRGFKDGLSSNADETQRYAARVGNRLCPVLLSIGNLVIVMSRAKPLPERVFRRLFKTKEADHPRWWGREIEVTRENLGVINGRIVAIDYGGPYRGHFNFADYDYAEEREWLEGLARDTAAAAMKD